MKIAHLRTYTMNSGQMDSWLTLFENKLIPLMEKQGIKVESYWVNEENTQFIWIRSYGNSIKNIKQKEDSFYGSEWWKKNVDFVRGHISHREIKLIKQ